MKKIIATLGALGAGAFVFSKTKKGKEILSKVKISNCNKEKVQDIKRKFVRIIKNK